MGSVDFRPLVMILPIVSSVRRASLSLLLLHSFTLTRAADLPPGYEETRIASGLNPVTMTFAPDGRLFLCEKQGLLRIISDDRMMKEPALDLTSRVDSWNERGLLSVCFDPEFSSNGWIYIYYTHNRDPRDDSRQSSNNRVSRFTLKGDRVDPASEKVIIDFDHLSKIGWHNGGGLAFGADGKLYTSTGENSNGANAQDGRNLLGKLMRFNKDGSIPTDNPYYRTFKGDNRSIVALGLRNPFSIAVRKSDGLLYTNMVGANFEQIERYETASPPERINYGWPGIDGPPKKDGPLPDHYRAPEYAYDHGQGKGLAICSGDFYQPSRPGEHAFPEDFSGKYFFGDYGGWIGVIDPANPAAREDFASGINRALDVKFAPDGTLYYIERAGIPGGSDEANSASSDGSVWRVRWTGGGVGRRIDRDPGPAVKLLPGLKLPTEAGEAFPDRLSATGIFTDRALTPLEGLVPYGLNSTIWADHATIRRWVALPKGAKIGFSPTGEFTWPGGSVFIQHFEMPGMPTTRRLETRVLVLDGTGSFGYGASYRWRSDGTDADLVPGDGQEAELSVTDPSGSTRKQKWLFPSNGLCFLCHTPAAGFVIGPKTRQLNGDFTYPDGQTSNQLTVWNRLGMFKESIAADPLATYPKTCGLEEKSASLEDRARSYLDGNCAHCHRPGGTGGAWDARFETPLSEQGILNADPRNALGIPGAKLLAPGHVDKSLLHVRMASTEATGQMPPLTRHVPDAAALEVLKDWILQSSPADSGSTIEPGD